MGKSNQKRTLCDGLLLCPKCGSYKSLNDFHNCHGATFDRAYYCKRCANVAARKHHALRVNNPQVRAAKRSDYLKYKHGLTLVQYIEKLKAQGSKCAICSVELQTSGSGTHLDHDHKTGLLRAFLCTNCNRGLGHFQDSLENLQNAIKYLQTHSTGVDSVEGEVNL